MMTVLVYSKTKKMDKSLNSILIRVNKCLWIGKITQRELDLLKKESSDNSKLGFVEFFNVSEQDCEKYFKKMLDFSF